jgi:hypothetical protein
MEPLEVETPHPQIPRLYLKLISAGFSFFVAGINDGSLGSLIPYIRQGYHINTNLIAVVYVLISSPNFPNNNRQIWHHILRLAFRRALQQPSLPVL